MDKRLLGKTGERLSVIGFGGLVAANETPRDANYFVSKAINRGINYFDVAPVYGNAQELLGHALKPYRDSIFLACKTLKRTKKEATAELHHSLKKLNTDHFDLYQFHGVITQEDVNRIFGPEGALEAFVDAKRKGLIRYIGFSAHTEEAAIALMDRYDFDSVLFPFNWVCWFNDNYGCSVLNKALEKHTGILALKALAKRNLEGSEENKWSKCRYCPVDDYEEASLALKFTLSLPVTAAVSPAHSELLWWACDAADGFTRITEQELELLREKAKNYDSITDQLKLG